MVRGANLGELDAAVRDAARVGAPDRYISALLAPKSVRAELIALGAFSAEIEKIPLTVSEPHLGEVRIQWWRWIGPWLGAVARREPHGRFVANRIGSQKY